MWLISLLRLPWETNETKRIVEPKNCDWCTTRRSRIRAVHNVTMMTMVVVVVQGLLFQPRTSALVQQPHRHYRHSTTLSSSSSSSSSTMLAGPYPAAPQRLRQLLQSEMDGTRFLGSIGVDGSDTATTTATTPILLPCCYDGLSARLIAQSGHFQATFLTGFGASAVHGFPDTQLLSVTEMQQTARMVLLALASAVREQSSQGPQPQQQQPQEDDHDNNQNGEHSPRRRPNEKQPTTMPIPCIVDGDTGYGNEMNCKRTIWEYGQMGVAAVMIEDQVSPKRCGHVQGKSVVSRKEAIARVKAACDARDEYELMYGPGTGPLILARTDAVQIHGFEEAIERCLAFREMAGCDMTFLEAPESIEQMQEYCRQVPGPKLANMLEQGRTPILSSQQLKQIGYTMVAYPLTLLSASIRAMQQSLDRIYTGLPTDDLILNFQDTKHVVGFTHYYQEEQRYR